MKSIAQSQTHQSVPSPMALGRFPSCSVSSSVSEGLLWCLIAHVTFRVGLAHGKLLIHGSCYFHCYLDSREKDFKTADVGSARSALLLIFILKRKCPVKWLEVEQGECVQSLSLFSSA